METVRIREQINSLDLVKFIGCFLIIAIHADPIPHFPTASVILCDCVTRAFLAFFFLSAGYLLSRRLSAAEEGARHAVFRRYVGRIFRLWGVWTLVYIPFFLMLKREDLQNFRLSVLLDWAWEILHTGSFFHLWFLSALLVGTLLIYGLRRMWCAPPALVYALGLAGHSYGFLLDGVPALAQIRDGFLSWYGTTRDGIFCAPLFLALGWWVAGWKRLPSIRASVLGLAASMLLLAAEALWLRTRAEQRELYVMLPLAGLCLLLTALHIQLDGGRIWKVLRTYSTLIYLVHPIQILLFRVVFGPFGPEDMLIRYCFAAVGALLAAAIAVRLGRTRRFAWATWFY